MRVIYYNVPYKICMYVKEGVEERRESGEGELERVGGAEGEDGVRRQEVPA